MSLLNIEIPKYLLMKEEDSNEIPNKILSEIQKLKFYYENRIEYLMAEINDLKNKLKMDKTIKDFIDNFDKVNQRLCSEIDKIKLEHNYDLKLQHEQFYQRLNNFKIDIFQKIVDFREDTISTIYKGTSSREQNLKAQVTNLLEQLTYCYDSFEVLHNESNKLKQKLALANLANEELQIIIIKYKKILALFNRKNPKVDFNITNEVFSLSGKKESKITHKKNNNSNFSGSSLLTNYTTQVNKIKSVRDFTLNNIKTSKDLTNKSSSLLMSNCFQTEKSKQTTSINFKNSINFKLPRIFFEK